MIIDHTAVPTDIAAACKALKHVVFLGTGARSYMNPEELAERGITVHTIKGYGDTAVAECAIALMWASAKSFGEMDRGMREGNWLRRDALQLTGKTLGLIGFGGIAAEAARMARGCGMKVIAWNRSPKTHPGVDSFRWRSCWRTAMSSRCICCSTTRPKVFCRASASRMMRPGSILINTARGAVVDEDAMWKRCAPATLRMPASTSSPSSRCRRATR